ncbi:hypothetical protein M196_gp18 [Halorubrum tailed virus 4]|uniref:Uncharacterized protein n=1 Tax=Halorubrum tailed virus 4 TaxID=1273752 RepID=R4TKB5_9CAUD|nr:hypothetical protein M196_gp18 [Halorubrum tailed virus 4]AGM11112.1 hypothetical protein HRTV4_18 [Halorubrum tailed virus 4]
MTPTTMHETLDTQGLLDTSHNAGTYALEVTTPSDTEGVARAFREVSEAVPPDEVLDRLTAARVAYVGASGDVYGRLMDHAEGAVRKALFLRAFDVTGVVGVWPESDPFQHEYNRAVSLSNEGWTVWTDGEVI